MREVLASSLSRSACNKDNLLLRTSSQRLLSDLISRPGFPPGLLRDSLTPASMRVSYHSGFTLPPALVESMLHLWGPLVEDELLRTGSIDGKELGSLLGVLRPLLHESRVSTPQHSRIIPDSLQPFDLRYSAALCLSQLPSIWGAFVKTLLSQGLQEVELDARLLAYDILNDDDDELRDIGVSIAADMLAAPKLHPTSKREAWVPLAASQHILKSVVRRYRRSSALCSVGIQRLTGSKYSQSEHALHPSSENMLAESGREDSALFVIEKQNLYIDEIREANRWSAVLRKLSARAIATNEGNGASLALFEWVSNGLAAVLKKAQNIDSALGWCSNSENFILVWRILCGAEVLIFWACKQMEISKKAK